MSGPGWAGGTAARMKRLYMRFVSPQRARAYDLDDDSSSGGGSVGRWYLLYIVLWYYDTSSITGMSIFAIYIYMLYIYAAAICCGIVVCGMWYIFACGIFAIIIWYVAMCMSIFYLLSFLIQTLWYSKARTYSFEDLALFIFQFLLFWYSIFYSFILSISIYKTLNIMKEEGLT